MSVRSFWGWAGAFIGSVLLNVSLFGLMPGLIQKVPVLPEVPEEIKQARIIQVKRAPSAAARKKAGKNQAAGSCKKNQADPCLACPE